MITELFIPAFIVAIIWAYMAIIEKKLLKHVSYITLFILFGLFIGFISLLLLIYYNKSIKEDIIFMYNKISYIILMLYGLIYIIASLIYLKLMKNHYSYLVVALTYTTPLFVTLFSYFELKENIDIKSVLGILLIVSGCITISLNKKD